MVLDIIEFKLFKPPISKVKRKAPTNICKISFLNKCVELVNVPHIFHDSPAKACLPTDAKFYDPTALYSLINPVRCKIFNFDKFIHDLDVEAFLQDTPILPRNCEGFVYIDKDNQHIVAADFWILRNKTKGPKYPK